MNMKAIGVRKALILVLSVLLITCAFAFTAAAEDETYALNLQINVYDETGEEGTIGIKAYLAPGDTIDVDTLIAKYPALSFLSDYVPVTDKTVGMPADGLMPAEDLTLEVYYEARPFTVTWIVDGETVATEKVAYGATPVFKGETPAKAADAQFTYTFTGWDVEAAPVYADTTYTAQFDSTVNEYTVTWIVEGAETKVQVPYGTLPTFNGTPSKDADAEFTYVFTGWSPEVVEVVGDATYTAQFSQSHNFYNVTWVVDGETVKIDTVEYGLLPSFTPTKENTAEFTYTFSGWDKEITPVTGHVTYTGSFTETRNSYTVTWVVDGETAKTEVLEYGLLPSFTPTKENTAQYTYTFAGWDKEIVPVVGDVTYTGSFDATVNKYKVTWVVEGVTSTVEVEYGTVPTFDGTPSKAPDAQYTYTFAGWTPEVVAVTGDATYTAVFDNTPNTVSVTFKVEGQADVTVVVQIGSMPEFPNGTPSKAADAQYSYTFKGWDKELAAATEDVIYTALFTSTLNKYTITWVVGDQTTTTVVEYGTIPTFDGSTDRATDAQYVYTFAGWDTEPVAVTGDATYTAQYNTTVRKYYVYFYYGHNVVLPTIVEYGQAAKAPTNTDKAPTAQYTYTFDGWDVDFSNITGPLKVYAKYTESIRTYTVTFKYGDGKTETVTVEYGKAATAPTDTDKAATETATYTFKGWDAEFSEVTADITVNAVYEETPIVVPPTVDTSALQAVIDAYKAAGLDTSAEALTKAEAALNDGSLTQADIDALAAALQAAIDESKETDTSEPDTNEPEDPTEAPTDEPEDPTEAPTETESESETEGPVAGGCGNTWIWIVLVIVLVGGGAAVVIILLRRKNATDPEPTEPEAEPEVEPVVEEEPAAEPEAPVASLFIPLGEEIPEEEEIVAPEDLEIVEEISVEDVDSLMSDKVAETLLEESEELGGYGKMGIINVGVISAAFQAGDVVDLNALQQKGMIDGNVGRLKVLASGTLDKPLTIKADAFSVQAIKMITLTGGHAIHLGGGK